ncbi:hypothetical protein [Streptomyces sp. CoH27]|uniref:hypothetical protein n=1 Tax=Streptomyces sp. CoH27 TaxID=2875763 RepID=UPI001CD4B292|nr:hypothetical protein [Streptomyces sp. CoH27]
MDPYLATLAGEAGTAFVAVLVGEGWQQARDGIVALWRRNRPQDAERVSHELETSRRTLLTAAQNGDSWVQDDIAADWRRQVAGLLGDSPDAAEELRGLLTRLGHEPSRQEIRGGVRFEARASGSARIYQSVGDQHITER